MPESIKIPGKQTLQVCGVLNTMNSILTHNVLLTVTVLFSFPVNS